MKKGQQVEKKDIQQLKNTKPKTQQATEPRPAKKVVKQGDIKKK